MKKLIMIAMALIVFALPSVAYAEAEIVYQEEKEEIVFDSKSFYDVYIDGIEQPYDALYGDWKLFLPIKKMYMTRGASATMSADGSIETLQLGEEILEINRAENEMRVSGKGAAYTVDCGEINGVLYVTSYDYQYEMNNMIIPVDDKNVVHILTLEGAEKKLEERNELFKVQSPELYNAFEKMLSTPYSFDYDIITNIKMTPGTEEIAASLPFTKLVLKLSSKGYVNLLRDNLELSFEMSMDAGPTLKESIEGAKLMLIKNMIYVYDPQWDDWDSDEILDRKQYNEAKAILSDSNNASAWLLVDHITELPGADGSVTYKAIIKADELKEAFDAVTFDGYYQMMLEILEEERMFVNIENIEFTYVIKDGNMIAQHVEVDLDMSVEGVQMALDISGDGQFHDYGIEKNLVLPREFRPSLQPKSN